ncbi:ammonium transporter [Henriciella mobilis]|uniref:Ammonium transporter n=1 Tax=Henriciella mobilis TaxID=2305467 RepID=A0A399RL83_9PROT|nr:ammonium transporter [Henriciella mobilis]RIJ30485.1 ammonium transporter [Henriciella mobilis]
MSSLVKGIRRGMALVPLAAFGALGASAQEASEVSAYVDSSYLFLIGGLIVMFMAAGFCMLEAGLVRKKNAAMQSMKNVALFSVAGIMFWLVGYNMAYPGATIAGGWFGIPNFIWTPADDLGTGYASASDWFFQMVFVATAASIVSGTVAERVKLWPFLIFTAFLTAFIYPIVASWEWGGGALDSQFAFSDFAGSTLVHSTGGWAALVGAIIIGPRVGKFVNGEVHPMPGSNIPLAALGTFILWFGWFGFNGASQLAAGTFDDINAVAMIFANTNMAACGGVLAAMILTAILYKGKVDATMAFNGAIGGLVSITAEPLMPSMGLSILIGAIGGVLVVLTVPLLDKLKIDDVVGAIPAHLVCGIWGTMIVPLSHGGGFGIDTTDAATPSYLGQFIGVLACGIFVSIASAIVWMALKVTLGVRPSEEEELAGMDKSEVGLEAYPEFG